MYRKYRTVPHRGRGRTVVHFSRGKLQSVPSPNENNYCTVRSTHTAAQAAATAARWRDAIEPPRQPAASDSATASSPAVEAVIQDLDVSSVAVAASAPLAAARSGKPDAACTAKGAGVGDSRGGDPEQCAARPALPPQPPPPRCGSAWPPRAARRALMRHTSPARAAPTEGRSPLSPPLPPPPASERAARP